MAQVRGAIQVGAIQVARWWRELEFSQNLSSAGGSDHADLKMSSLYFTVLEYSHLQIIAVYISCQSERPLPMTFIASKV